MASSPPPPAAAKSPPPPASQSAPSSSLPAGATGAPGTRTVKQAKKLPSHRGFLGVLEKKQWVPRLVVIRDEGDCPTISIYDAAASNPPDEKMMVREIKMEGNIEVGDYMDNSDATGRFTLRKPQARPNAFTLLIGSQSFGFEAASAEGKAGWLDKLHMYVIKHKLKDAGPVGQSGKLLPSHRGYLGVFEKKAWVARSVVLRDGVVPTVTVYDLAGRDPPDESSLIFEVKLEGRVDVGDFVPPSDLAGRLTMRKAEVRPNAFTLFVNDKPYSFEAANAEIKQGWIDKIYSYIVRYKLKDVPATPKIFKGGLPNHSGYMGVLEKNVWTARLVYIRDGPNPTVSIYDAAAKEPPDEDMLVSEIPLVGFVEVGDFKPADAGRMTLRAKAEPRPDSFSLIVNDKVYSFDAVNAEKRATWMAKFRAYIDKYKLNDNVVVETQTRSSLTNFVRKKRATEAGTEGSAAAAGATGTKSDGKPMSPPPSGGASPASPPSVVVKNSVRQEIQAPKDAIKGTVRGTMRGLPATLDVDKLLPSHRGYLGVFEKKKWVARLVVIRDGPVPVLSVYDASAPDPPDESMLIREVPLTGNVEVGDFIESSDVAGRLTLKKPEPRANAFTLLIGNNVVGLEAANADVKSQWVDKIYTFMVKSKLKDASAVGPAGKLLPSHRGFLGVFDKKAWTARCVVLRDGVIPTISVYDVSAGDPPDESMLVQEIKLVGKCDLGDYTPEVDLGGRLTLRKADPRPNAFNLMVGDKTYRFEGASLEVRNQWMDKIYSYIMRYKLKDAVATPVLFKGLPTYNGYLGVQEKSSWVARLCYLRDGPVPGLSIYDAAAKDPPDEAMLVTEVPLVGFVEVGEFKVPASGLLSLRAKTEPRPNGFTLLVNDKVFSFDAASQEIKQAWIGKFYAFIEKYKLNENAPIQSDSKKSITTFVRRKRPEEYAAEAAAAKKAGGTAGGAAGDGTPELHNLPEDVINPFEDDYNAVFENDLFGEDD
jgi:hypothetical protein